MKNLWNSKCQSNPKQRQCKCICIGYSVEVLYLQKAFLIIMIDNTSKRKCRNIVIVFFIIFIDREQVRRPLTTSSRRCMRRKRKMERNRRNSHTWPRPAHHHHKVHTSPITLITLRVSILKFLFKFTFLITGRVIFIKRVAISRPTVDGAAVFMDMCFQKNKAPSSDVDGNNDYVLIIIIIIIIIIIKLIII